jgi:NitT/TauT family transport system substrate-binding protein
MAKQRRKNTMTERSHTIAVTVLLLFSVLSICPALAGEPVHYRLKWLFNSSVAGDLVAEDLGLFKQKGLNVLVKPGSPERDAIKELELERAQFGVASADQIIRALDKGAPIIVIAQLFQVNPLQWIFRPARTTIQAPADLKGKIIGITYGGIDENIMKALLARHGIRESDLTFYSVRYDFTPFYKGKVDLWPIYRNAQGPIIGGKINAEGETVDYFNPDAHGIHTVANSVMTSEAVLKESPELVSDFLEALLKGWEIAMDPKNLEKTAQTVHRFDDGTPIDIIRKQLELTRTFIKPTKEIRIGTIDQAAWKQTEQMMLDQRLISAPVNIRERLWHGETTPPPSRPAPIQGEGD